MPFGVKLVPFPKKLYQLSVNLKGEMGFFRDLQSLLFLCSVHYLLPHLDKDSTRVEHDALLTTMHAHTVLCWSDDPGHMFYLLAALLGYLGEGESRLAHLRHAVDATP